MRHHHIGEDQLDVGAAALEEAEGFLAVGGFQDFIAALVEDVGEQLADALFVLDQQQRLGATVGGQGLGRASPWSGDWAPRGRQMVKVAPAPGWLDTQMSPPLSLTMRWTVLSPSPVPLPCSLVVKNGSKMWAMASASMPWPLSLMDRVRIGPGRIPCSRATASPMSRVGGFDADPAAGGHCVAGVQDQVHDDLLHLSGVGDDPVEVRAEAGFQVDVLADDQRQHALEVGDDSRSGRAAAG